MDLLMFTLFYICSTLGNISKGTYFSEVLIRTLMTIYFYRASANGCFCVLEKIFVNIPKIAKFLLYQNSEKYFYFLTVTKARTFLKNILDRRILRNFVTSLNIFYLPTFLLKYSEQEFS